MSETIYTKEELRKFIDSLKEYNAKATPGPWATVRSDGQFSPEGCYEIYESLEDDPPIIECHEWQQKENAILICGLRSNCDFIIEVLEKHYETLK